MPKSAENAIHQDALDQPSDIPNGDGVTDDDNLNTDPPKSKRELDMEAIASQRMKSLQADGVVFEAGDAPAAVTDPEPGDSQVDQLAAQLAEDDRPSYADMSARVKVKIEGEELELPLSEVVKSYQKDATASRRLTEATRLLEIAAQQASGVAKEKSGEDNADQHEDGKEGTAKKGDRLQAIKGAFSKLYEGDEEGAAEEMLRLMEEGATATQQPVIDPATITAQVRQQLAVESAYNEVHGDYPELFANTERGVVLGRETFQRMQAKEQAGVPRFRALRDAADEVANLFGVAKTGGRQTQEPQRTARDEKLTRKASLDIPGSANVAAGGAQSPAEASSVSETIQAMAAQRLGQSMRSTGRIN